MPCCAKVNTHSGAKNHFHHNLPLINYVKELGWKPPKEYDLSDCTGSHHVLSGTAKYFKWNTQVLDVGEILETLGWFRRAFVFPVMEPYSFNEIMADTPMTTSCGFPFTGYAKKRDLPPGVFFREFQSLDADYLAGREIWKSFNKEEVLPITDDILKETRQINGSPIRHYQNGRRLFGPFCDHLRDNYERYPFAFGMHVFQGLGPFVESLYNAEKVHVMDQSKQDAQFHAVIMYYLYRFMAEASGMPWTDAHDIFVFNEIFSMVLVNGHVIRTLKGNKSGSPNTLVINCLHSLLCITHSMRMDGMEYDVWYQAVFNDKLVVVCGDDALVDAALISAYALRFGFYACDAMLTLETRDGKNIVFCNAAFERVRGRLVRVPVDCKRLLASVLYKSTGDPSKTLSQLAAMRLHTVFVPAWFKLFDDMTHWHMERYSILQSQEWKASLSCVLPIRSLVAIHLGHEGVDRN